MKYLKQFESYRNQGKGQLPLQEINGEEFKKLLQENCKQFLKVANQIELFKNLEDQIYSIGPKELLFRKFKSNHGNFVLTNPKESEHRRIAPWSHYGNWHNLLVSNLNSWKDYPRRNKSMISSGWGRAWIHHGSDMYLVIPFDTTKIGVCSGNEFWEAFNVYKELGRTIPDWSEMLIDKLSVKTGVNLYHDDSWEELLPHLDKKYQFKFFDKYDINKTLLENLNMFLDPKLNKFRLETFLGVSKLQKESCRECWFEDKAILVNWKYLNTEGVGRLFDPNY